VKDTTAMLLRNGMIEERKDKANPLDIEVYQTTIRGQAWVEMLKNTPFPVCVWMDPRTIPDKEE
jgi:hypothetical protein